MISTDKKIAITGHTRGVGAGLWDYFADYEKIGFSKSEGWDLDHKQICDVVVGNVKNYDVFINNAPTKNQAYIFEKLHEMWYGEDKIIINISSNLGDVDLQFLESVEEKISDTNITPFQSYCETKSQLDKKSIDSVLNSHLEGQYYPWVLNFKPYGIDTDYIKNNNLSKYLAEDRIMSVDDFIDVFDYTMKIKDKVKITSITFTGATNVR
jgi:hypothetical protein